MSHRFICIAITTKVCFLMGAWRYHLIKENNSGPSLRKPVRRKPVEQRGQKEDKSPVWGVVFCGVFVLHIDEQRVLRILCFISNVSLSKRDGLISQLFTVCSD